MRHRFATFCLFVGAGCGSAGTDPGVPAGADLSFAPEHLRALDPVTEGRYEIWLVGTDGSRRSAGTFVPAATAALPVPDGMGTVTAVELTVEPPGDPDPAPSAQMLLRGTLSGGRTTMTVVGAVTQGTLSLREQPGQFTMFSPSDNLAHGYPSFEESGIWLFNMAPKETPQNDMWVRLTQVRSGWTYEGWMVRDYGTPNAIWLSYGKFRPDQSGAVNGRDDTGWGPYSGVLDFATAGEEEFPGDDWISNPYDFPFPADLTLPLNLREKDGNGVVRWSHVITIEPATDRGEAISTERPFLLEPYRDPFGDGAPGDARTITFRPDGVPRIAVTVR